MTPCSLGVALLKGLEGMPQGSRNAVCESTDADGLVACDTPPLPGVGRQVPKERDGGPPGVAPLRGQVDEGAVSRPTLRPVGLVIEAGRRRRVTSSDPERPVDKDPLGVAQVTDQFLDAPLARGIAIVA